MRLKWFQSVIFSITIPSDSTRQNGLFLVDVIPLSRPSELRTRCIKTWGYSFTQTLNWGLFVFLVLREFLKHYKARSPDRGSSAL